MNEKTTCDILIRNTSILDENFQIRRSIFIAIQNGTILSITSEEPSCLTATETIDGKDLLWMPGLIDGHMHTGQQLLKGAVLDELPMIWTRIMLPFESTLTPEKMRLSASLAALEMIKNGTTGFVDAGSYFMEEAARVYLASGLRGALSHSSMDQGNFPDSIRQTTEEVLASEDRLFDEFHGKGNLKVFYSLRALMNCSTALIRATAGRATERNTFFQAHMNEYAGEVNYTLEKFQLRPVEYLDSLGVLNADFLSAHSIMVSAHERSLLAENQVKVVHCPFSNCGKGVPDTPSLLVMNSFWGVKNADPAVMPAKTILKMATENGAHLLGEEKSGVLKERFKADLISINWRQPHLLATNNPVNTLLECVCGNDVSDSIVNGKLLMRNRQVLTLDEEKILWQAEKYFTSGEVSE